MAQFSIQVLGEITVSRDGEKLELPASKRTRALLAYLALTARPNRRDRLCEIFWDIPDDPRGALRWSLSKLRPIVNDPSFERLHADRERVTLHTSDIAIDLRSLARELESGERNLQRLRAMSEQLRQPLLDGLDLPAQESFQSWLTAERSEAQRMLAQVVSRLAAHSAQPPNEALAWARVWIELEPFHPRAATRLLTQLDKLGLGAELQRATDQLTERFRKAGVTWSADLRADALVDAPAKVMGRSPQELLQRQKIQFCTAHDGAKIAYASVGEGPPIIKAANWLSHLELDWDAPIWSPLFRELARDHHFVRYDERGNGLSDWQVDDISLQSFVTDLETVVDATGIQRFALLGISQGAAVSIAYAVRHPERVSHLILFGGYASGWRIGATEAVTREREAVMTLTATGWGQDNPAYRQIFSSTFLPRATAEELAWFNEFQRRTTSAENAVRFLSAFGDIDVRSELSRVRARTLVIHSLGDRRIPVAQGQALAGAIPKAEFLGLESDGHLLLGREPASQVFVRAVREFLARG